MSEPALLDRPVRSGFRRDAEGPLPAEMAKPARVIGIDVARGLAILGMMAVHILDPGPFPWVGSVPDDWDQFARGHSAILFAVIAGISIAIISGRTRPYTGVELLQARMRIMTRAVTVWTIGSILHTVPHNVAVILEVYGVTFVLALPFLSIPPRKLFPLTAMLAIVLPALTLILQNLRARGDLGDPRDPGAIVDLMVTGTYPALTWIVYVLLGLAVGRLALGSTVVRVRLILAGLVMGLLGTWIGRWAERAWPPEQGGPTSWFDFSRMASVEPHTETWFEVVQSSGIALVIVVGCIVLAPRVRVLVYPLAAAGAMALTVYTVHVASMHWIWPRLRPDNQYQYYLASVAVALVVATLWKLAFGQGPLERALSWLSWRAARI